MTRALLVVLAGPLALACTSGCEGCNPPGPPGADAGVVDAGQQADAGFTPPDAGPPDPNTVGLDARPTNTTCNAPQRPPSGGALDVENLWPNLQLTNPLLMLQEPGTNTMYAIQRGGVIVRWDKSNAAVTTPDPFGDIGARVNTSDSGNDELGLLGMAFHPDWPATQEIFLSYNGFGLGGLDDIVSRFTLRADGTLDENSEEIIIDVDDFAGNHNGGMIAFSPTDTCRTCLYFGDGDGGLGDDPNENGQFISAAQDCGNTAQCRNAFLGKILRVDVAGRDAGKNYAVPADNPFAADASITPEIYAYGLRNPWRWSFDRGTGDLWVGDVGQGRFEEIDRVESGGNYGWDILEADACHEQHSFTGTCNQGGFQASLTNYAHANGRVAVMGGYVYRGTLMPEYAGTYFYADFGTGEVFALTFDAQGNPLPSDQQVVVDLPGNVSSFSEDADGELYVIDHLAGTIQHLIPAGPPAPDNFPRRLSDTGCVDANDHTKPASGLIPYTVNHALWSDGAAKERFVALPEGQKATILADGDIDFPTGTVFMKNFIVGGERVETRLLVHHDDGEWGGYSYEWNGADADLVDTGGKSKTLANGQVWNYPSRNGCLSCHTAAAHRQLGWEIPQLNGGLVYESTGRFANQLHTLDAIGVFDGPLPDDPANLGVFPAVTDTLAPVESVARAYLHVNCAICHRPGGVGVANTDWRFDTAFASMALCNVDPTEGDLGVAGAKRFVPGDPASSLLSLRMKKIGAGRMPLLGSVVVDPDGTRVIDSWISSVTTCP